jgi:hypothetical protein
MASDLERLLTEGLGNGFAGKGKITRIERAGFPGKASDYPNQLGVYHDEWFTPSRLGGGQELVRIGNRMFTRLYGGGTPDPEVLMRLGIQDTDVNTYLRAKILELGEKTRLFTDCRPEPDGDWRYLYEVLMHQKEMGVASAIESITYQDVQVHLHPFILSPVE